MTTVLVVDDQSLIRSAVRDLLENAEDITVVGEAADGAVAIGDGTSATGVDAVAFGDGTIASGPASTALGDGTKANCGNGTTT